MLCFQVQFSKCFQISQSCHSTDTSNRGRKTHLSLAPCIINIHLLGMCRDIDWLHLISRGGESKHKKLRGFPPELAAMGLLHLVKHLDIKQDSSAPSLFYYKALLTSQILCENTTGQFSTLPHFKWSLAQRGWDHDWIVFTFGVPFVRRSFNLPLWTAPMQRFPLRFPLQDQAHV